MYTVRRQVQWPDGQKVVEVSQGYLDSANPDMLSPRCHREGRTYSNPKEAVSSTIDTCPSCPAPPRSSASGRGHGTTSRPRATRSRPQPLAVRSG
jgi:hypothetical protein